MKRHCGSIVEAGRETIKTLIEALSLNVYAEGESKDGDQNPDDNKGGDDDSSSSGSGSTINYEDLIAKARKEEKEKQYKTINRLREQIETMTKQHNEDLLKIASLEKDIKETKEKLTTAGKGDSEEVATLKKSIADLEKEKKDLEDKVKSFEDNKPVSREEIEKEVRESLEKEYEVKTYKAEKLAELKDDILVPELVFGDTKEEIDKSIQNAIERSKAIKKQLGFSNSQRRSSSSGRASNPSVSRVQDTDISLDKIARMDVSSPEYAELRKQLGLR